jgi:hypothetical protein
LATYVKNSYFMLFANSFPNWKYRQAIWAFF